MDRWPKSPMSGRSKQSLLRVDKRPKSPTGGWSKQKSPMGGQSKHHCYSLVDLWLIHVRFWLDELIDWQKWLHHLSYSNRAYTDNGRNRGQLMTRKIILVQKKRKPASSVKTTSSMWWTTIAYIKWVPHKWHM